MTLLGKNTVAADFDPTQLRQEIESMGLEIDNCAITRGPKGMQAEYEIRLPESCPDLTPEHERLIERYPSVSFTFVIRG